MAVRTPVHNRRVPSESAGRHIRRDRRGGAGLRGPGALGHRRHGQRPRKDSSRKTRGPGGKRPRHRNRHGQRA